MALPVYLMPTMRDGLGVNDQQLYVGLARLHSEIGGCVTIWNVRDLIRDCRLNISEENELYGLVYKVSSAAKKYMDVRDLEFGRKAFQSCSGGVYVIPVELKHRAIVEMACKKNLTQGFVSTLEEDFRRALQEDFQERRNSSWEGPSYCDFPVRAPSNSGGGGFLSGTIFSQEERDRRAVAASDPHLNAAGRVVAWLGLI